MITLFHPFILAFVFAFSRKPFLIPYSSFILSIMVSWSFSINSLNFSSAGYNRSRITNCSTDLPVVFSAYSITISINPLVLSCFANKKLPQYLKKFLIPLIVFFSFLFFISTCSSEFILSAFSKFSFCLCAIWSAVGFFIPSAFSCSSAPFFDNLIPLYFKLIPSKNFSAN